MHRVLLKSVVMAAIALATAAGSAHAEKLLVATDTAFVPFEFRQGDEYVGFDIDIWDAVATELGLDYEIKPMDFNGILPAIQSQNVDLALAGITITEERQKAVDFSDGYYDSGFLLMVDADSDIETTADLAGKTLALKMGTSAAQYAKEHFEETELKLFPNIDNAYLELQTGRVDAAMHDTPNVLYYIKTAGQGRVKTVGEQMMAHEYGIAFPKGSELVAETNKALAAIKADGRYAELYKKWFDAEPPTK